MLDAVAAYIRRYELIAPGDRVLVAVSGGADSLALLHLLARLAGKWRLPLTAAHLDHAIRAESREDASRVAEHCAALDVPLVVERIDVPQLARREGRGLEEAGREARRRFLRRIAADRGCRRIALGHHLDDQAETVLQRLLRGTGPGGLAAMRPRSGPFIRPLLGISGSTLRSWLQAQGLIWSEDSSNLDPTFTRNRIRHQLLPLLREFNPQVESALARLGALLAVEEDCWDEMVAGHLEGIARTVPGGFDISVAGLLALHPALRDRVLRRGLEVVRGGLHGIEACHVAALEDLLENGPQADAHLPGAWAGRRYQVLQLRCKPPPSPQPYSLEIPGPGRYFLPGGEVFEVEIIPSALGERRWRVEFAAGQMPWPLTVRSFAAGDRIALPAGGRQKVKEVLRAARLPHEERRRVPLVVADEVLWVAGLRRCAGRRPIPGEPVLGLSFERPAGGEN